MSGSTGLSNSLGENDNWGMVSILQFLLTGAVCADSWPTRNACGA